MQFTHTFYWALAVLVVTSLASANVLAKACASAASTQGLSHTAWGMDLNSTRHQRHTTINASNVHQLTPAWSFGLDGDSPHSYPLVSADTIYVGDTDGRVHALDRDSGCSRWVFEADAEIRTAMVPGILKTATGEIPALFFGTFKGSVYAIRSNDGEQLWQIVADPHLAATMTGTPLFYDNVLYAPVSSYEVILAAMPLYGCCDFRGSMLALDATTGETIWRTYTVENESKASTDNLIFPDKMGPSGAPIWSAPTLDIERQQILFGSGENYSDPPTAGSDAIWALDMATGKVNWRHQFTQGDAWNAGCNSWFDSNCPEANGPDLDFGAPPILIEAGEVDIVLAGQKSANVFAMKASNGELLWQRDLGRGGMLGGIHWGMAANPDKSVLYIPINDRILDDSDIKAAPGLHALDINTGESIWFTPNSGGCTKAKDNCHNGMSAAIISTPDLVFAGGLDGRISAYDAETGDTKWSYETWRSFDTVNGVDAHGGAIDTHGPLVIGDLLIVTSGYAGFGQGGGNTLIVFTLPH